MNTEMQMYEFWFWYLILQQQIYDLQNQIRNYIFK